MLPCKVLKSITSRSFSPGADSPMGSYWARGSENLNFWNKQPKRVATRAQCGKELTKNNQTVHSPQKVTTNTERRILLNKAFLNLKWPRDKTKWKKGKKMHEKIRREDSQNEFKLICRMSCWSQLRGSQWAFLQGLKLRTFPRKVLIMLKFTWW